MPNTQNRISIDSVEPNSTVLVKGIIAYSHIATKVDGQELALEQQRRSQRNQIPPTRPFTTMTLHSVTLLAQDPNNLTMAEKFVAQCCYASKNTERQPGLSISLENKGAYLPAVGVQNADGSYTQVYPTSELANGQEVIVVIRIFKAKMHNGRTFDAVLVQAPELEYRNPGGARLTNVLAERGIVWHPTAEPMSAVDEGAAVAAQAAQTLPLNQAAPTMNVAPQTNPAIEVPMQPAVMQQQAVADMPATAVPIAGTNPTGIRYDPLTK